MLADGPIEIEFPSLTRSGEQPTQAETAPPPESDDSDDGDGDDFAWLAAAFTDDDDDVDDAAPDVTAELDEYEPDEVPSEEDFAELWEPVDGEPDSLGVPSDPEEPAGRSLAGAEPLPTINDEPRSPLASATASGEDDPGRLLLGAIPALKTAIAGRGAETPPVQSAVHELRPDPSDAEPRDHEADEVTEPAVIAEGTPRPANTGRRDLDAEREAPVEDPDLTVEEPVDINEEAATPDESEEAATPDLSIEAIRRRPGFREELLAAFGQIYKR